MPVLCCAAPCVVQMASPRRARVSPPPKFYCDSNGLQGRARRASRAVTEENIQVFGKR